LLHQRSLTVLALVDILVINQHIPVPLDGSSRPGQLIDQKVAMLEQLRWAKPCVENKITKQQELKRFVFYADEVLLCERLSSLSFFFPTFNAGYGLLNLLLLTHGAFVSFWLLVEYFN
jgi:hypothetical protein